MTMKINGYDIKKNGFGLYDVSKDGEHMFTYPDKKQAVEACKTDFLHNGE